MLSISFLYKNVIAINEPKLTIISKLISFVFILNIFFKINKCPLDEIGIGSVKPCIMPKIIYLIIL